MTLLLFHFKNDYANGLPMLLSMCAKINNCVYVKGIAEFLEVLFLLLALRPDEGHDEVSRPHTTTYHSR